MDITCLRRGLCGLALIVGGLPAQEPCGTFDVLDVPFDPGWNRALILTSLASPRR